MELMNDKLKRILAEAVITFCQHHVLYIDELKIQGTVVVTTDCSSIFVTQLSEKHRRTSCEASTAVSNRVKLESVYDKSVGSENQNQGRTSTLHHTKLVQGAAKRKPCLVTPQRQHSATQLRLILHSEDTALPCDDDDGALPYNSSHNMQSPEFWYQPGETVFPGLENRGRSLSDPTPGQIDDNSPPWQSNVKHVKRQTVPIFLSNAKGCILKNVVQPLKEQVLSEGGISTEHAKRMNRNTREQSISSVIQRHTVKIKKEDGGPDHQMLHCQSSHESDDMAHAEPQRRHSVSDGNFLHGPGPPVLQLGSPGHHAAALSRLPSSVAEVHQNSLQTYHLDRAPITSASSEEQQNVRLPVKVEDSSSLAERTFPRSFSNVKPAMRMKTSNKCSSGFSLYKCPYCVKSYRFGISLKRHIETRHLGRRFKCKHCETEFDSVAGLSSHTRMKHKQLMRYECHLCGQRFNTNSAMGQHITRLHYDMM